MAEYKDEEWTARTVCDNIMLMYNNNKHAHRDMKPNKLCQSTVKGLVWFNGTFSTDRLYRATEVCNV